MRCRLFVYGPANAIASQTPSSLASFKSRLVLPIWYRLTQVVLGKRPLNGCSSSSSSSEHPIYTAPNLSSLKSKPPEEGILPSEACNKVECAII